MLITHYLLLNSIDISPREHHILQKIEQLDAKYWDKGDIAGPKNRLFYTGTAAWNSEIAHDIDIVCTSPIRDMLIESGFLKHNETFECGKSAQGSLVIRGTRINIIQIIDNEQYKQWKCATEMMNHVVKYFPNVLIDREHRHFVFEQMRLFGRLFIDKVIVTR